MQNVDETKVQPIERWAFVLLGLFQGLVGYELGDGLNVTKQTGWLVTFASALLSAVCFSPTLFFTLRFDLARAPSVRIGGGIALSLFCLWALYVYRHSNEDILLLFFMTGIAMLAASAVIRAVHQPGGMPLGQRILLSGWSSTLAITVAFITGWIVWGLVYLSATLVQYAGLKTVGDFLQDGAVLTCAYGGGAAFVIAIMAERGRLMDGVVQIIILSCRYLFLAIAALSVLAVVSLFFGGSDDVSRHISIAGLCLSLAAAAYITGITGQIEPPRLAPALRQVQRWAWLVPPFLIVYALYAIIIRVSAYGVTPERIALISAASIGLCLAIATALSAITGRITRWNSVAVTSAVGAVSVFYVLCALPWIGWWDISLTDQTARLFDEDGTLNSGPAHYVWFSGAERGKQTLRTAQANAKTKELKRAIRAVQESSSYAYRLEPDNSERNLALLKSLDVRPDKDALPRDFLDIDGWDLGLLNRSMYTLSGCIDAKKTMQCSLVVADVTHSSPGAEVLLMKKSNFGANLAIFVRREDDNRWQLGQTIQPIEPQPDQNKGETGIEVVAPLKSDIIVDGVRYGF